MRGADVPAGWGPRGRHDPARGATRHGHGAGSVSLGGRRVPVRRPRMRATDRSGELPVASYELFSGTEMLGRMAMERMLAGLSTRRYPVGLEPVGARTEQAATSTSRSAVSRRFVAATETALAQLLAQDLSQLDLVGLMIDGVHFGEHCCVVALGIGIDGTKHPLSLVEGSTENATLVTELIVGLRERGLDVTRPVLVVLDGAKALRRAVLDVFDRPVLARCQLHRSCKETTCSSGLRRRMMWYAGRCRGSRSACPTVRGVAAASERTSAATRRPWPSSTRSSMMSSIQTPRRRGHASEGRSLRSPWRRRLGCWGMAGSALSRRRAESAPPQCAGASLSWSPVRTRCRSGERAGQAVDDGAPTTRTRSWPLPCSGWWSRMSGGIRCHRCAGRPSHCGTWPRNWPDRTIRSPRRPWAGCCGRTGSACKARPRRWRAPSTPIATLSSPTSTSR